MKGWFADYRLLLGVLLKDSFRQRVGGRIKLPQSVIMGICCLPLMVMLCTAIASVADLAVKYSLLVEGTVMLVTAGQGMVLFFAIPTLTSALYMSGDTGFVSALPLRRSAVFFARLTKVYIGELAITAYLLLPTLYTFGGAAQVAGGVFSPAFYVLVPFITLLAPVLPLALATLLSLPAMWIASFLKRKAFVSTIALIFVYMVLFVAYFLLIPNFSSVGDIESLSETVVNAFRQFAAVMYPDKVIACVALGVDPWVNLGIAIGIWVGIITLIFALSSLFYRRAVRINTEFSRSTEAAHGKVFRKRSLLASLMIADLKNIFRFPALALSMSTSVFVTSLITVFFFLTTEAGASQDDFTPLGEMMQTGILLMLGVMLGGSNYFALMAFTREGKSFYLTRTLPISGKTAVLAKFILSNAANVIGALLMFIITAAFGKIHIVNAALIAVVMIVVCAGLNALSIYFDMRRPYFDWKSLYDVQRQNARVMAPVMIGMCAGIVFLIAAIVIMPYSATMGTVGAYAVYWAVCFVVAAASAGGLCYMLFDKAEELYAAMGERASAPVSARTSRRGDGFLGGPGSRNGGGMLK